MQVAGPEQTGEAVRAAAPATSPGVPSWSRVLATTISLWLSRRVPRVRRPLALLVIGVLVLGAAAVTIAVFAGTSASSRGAAQGRPHVVRPRAAPSSASSASSVGEVARARAAAWVAGELGSDETVGCDPVMCAALGAHGVAASRLMPLGPSGLSASGADVLAASPSSLPSLARAAPVLLASFGSGASMIEVRAPAPGGAAAYQHAVRADLAARRSAGAQLLRSGRLVAGARNAGQLRAGAVDSRLLIMLAMLASQHYWRVVAFGDASPGVPSAPLRQAVITGPDARALAAALALARAQRTPYQPAQATVVGVSGGQQGLLIDFAAPSPLGLLTGGAPG